MRSLVVIPAHNEARHVATILAETRMFAPEILVVDDGSDDGTEKLLAAQRDVFVLRHPVNRGYGRSLIDAFDYAVARGYDVVVTLDADGQHEPQYIPWFLEEIRQADIVSGSRYLVEFDDASIPPPDRRGVNREITRRLRCHFGLRLTDAFCGFKAYRTSALARMELTEDGYAMPLELWAQASYLGLTIKEIPVKLIYQDERRSFGGNLDQSNVRLRYYLEVLERAREHVKLKKESGQSCCCGCRVQKDENA